MTDHPTPQAEIKRLRVERGSIIEMLKVAEAERDELRAANITPDNDGPPLGQSVSYWQDRCLDHATALDRCRAERDRLRAALRATALRAWSCREAAREALEGDTE